MSNNNNMQPIYILPEDTKRTTGKDAQRNNILAAKAVAQAVRTTLGPKGMDKMIVDSFGNVIVTNDGVTILKEMHIEHPAAKMVVEVAKTQESAVGDGTTTAVIIAGELLKKAEELLDQNIHPTSLTKGFRLAEQKAQEVLSKLAQKVTPNDKDILAKVAITAMTGKGAETNKEELSNLLVKALNHLIQSNSNLSDLSNDDIKVELHIGSSANQSYLVEGVVISKERVHSAMPTKITEGAIALLDYPIEIKNTEIDAKIQITDPSQLNAFLDQEERTLQAIVSKIKESGANVVFCQRGIDDLAQHFLAKSGILALRRVKKSDMEALAKATSAKIVSSWKDLQSQDLGYAGFVHQEKVGSEEMVFVERCKNSKVVTLLLKATTQHVGEEVKRAVVDAIGDLIATIKDGFVVAGAGAVEMELSKELHQYAANLSSREQLAVIAFAQAMEIIPRTLAENAGMDPLDFITKLRTAHDQKQKWAGVNVFTGEVMDAWQEGVIEPLKIKTQALSSAVEVAQMILRIDDVILGSTDKRASYPSPSSTLDM